MQEEFGSGVESESSDEDVDGIPSLGLLSLDIALRHFTSCIFEEERGQLLNDGRPYKWREERPAIGGAPTRTLI